MREVINRGASIDIDDFERRLRSQEARRAAQADPLRELARLMQEPETDATAQRYSQIFDDHRHPAEEAETDSASITMRRTRPRKPPLRRSTTRKRSGVEHGRAFRRRGFAASAARLL